MKLLNILSAVLIVLIVGCFAFMMTMLILSNFNAFFISGGVLVALLLAGVILKKVRQHETEKEDMKNELQ